jgi:hypothetical protein
MTCPDIQRDAAGLASLPRGASERRAAFEHARTCAACAAALAEGESLMRVLGEALPLEATQPEALSRAKAEIMAELRAEAVAGGGLDHPVPPRRRPVGVAGALMGAVAAAYLLATGLGTKLPPDGRAAASVAVALTAVLATGIALLLGTSVPLIPVVSFAVSGWKAGPGALDPAVGLHCLGFEGMMSLLPLTLAAVLAWRRRLDKASGLLMTAAAGGALAGQAALHALCHAQQSYAHLLVFHTGGVLLALAIGAAVARLLRAPIASRR